MTAFEVFLTLVSLVALVAAITMVAWLVLRALSPSVERLRAEREAQRAAWRIHQQATDAFEAMLDAARQNRDRDR